MATQPLLEESKFRILCLRSPSPSVVALISPSKEPYIHCAILNWHCSSHHTDMASALFFFVALNFAWYIFILVCLSFIFPCAACVLSRFSPVQLCVTLWTVACQDPPSLGFSKQKYWSVLPCPHPGDHPDPGIKPCDCYVSCFGRWVLYN